MADDYEVKVTVGDAVVEVRGKEQGVVAIVRALSEVLSGSSHTDVSEGGRGGGTSVDARSFFAEKAPAGNTQAATVAAYYLREVAPPEERSETINEALATNVFRQAQRRLPSRMRDALSGAEREGYLDRVSPGTYRLSPVGYNLVMHTLGQQEV